MDSIRFPGFSQQKRIFEGKETRCEWFSLRISSCPAAISYFWLFLEGSITFNWHPMTQLLYESKIDSNTTYISKSYYLEQYFELPWSIIKIFKVKWLKKILYGSNLHHFQLNSLSYSDLSFVTTNIVCSALGNLNTIDISKLLVLSWTNCQLSLRFLLWLIKGPHILFILGRIQRK